MSTHAVIMIIAFEFVCAIAAGAVLLKEYRKLKLLKRKFRKDWL